MLNENRYLTNKKGSITVEASLVLPIFIYGIVAFLYFLQIFFIQDTIQSAITQTGEWASQYAFVYEYIKNYGTNKELNPESSQKEEDSTIKNLREEFIDIKGFGISTFFQMKTKEYLDENLMNHSCVIGGVDGISFEHSRFLEQDDMIEITVLYQIKIPVPIYKIGNISAMQSVKVRAFTGYKPPKYLKDKEGENGEDKIVYITRTGTVYHLRRDCTYLKFNISNCILSEVGDKRNDNGGKYYKCESCIGKGKLNQSDTVYITSDGTRYHSSLSCSRLKRSIIEILLSKVKNRAPCSRCGN